MSDTMPFYQSKTFWANVIAVVLVALGAIVSGDLVSPEIAKWLVVAVTVLNAVLTIFWKTGETQSRLTLRK